MQDRTVDVTYIVVNYKTSHLLAKNLAAAAKSLSGLSYELIVVENGGDGPDVEEIVAKIPEARVEISPANVGFGAAVNLGARVSQGEYLFVANPDSFVSPQCMRPIWELMEKEPQLAVVGPKILDEDGGIQESARRFPSFLTGLFGRTSFLTRVFPKNPFSQRELLAAAAPQDSYRIVEWVSGAAFMARRSAFEEVGGFDEGYFLYWEDADLCKRLGDAGYPIAYFPQAEVTHLVGQSMASAQVLSRTEFHKSAYKYYVTHNVPWAPFPMRWALAGILGARAVVKISVGWLQGLWQGADS